MSLAMSAQSNECRRTILYVRCVSRPMKHCGVCSHGSTSCTRKQGANTEVFEANGTAERDAGLLMLEQIPGTKQVTVGGDKAYDTSDFVAECRNLKVTPHVAQNPERPGGSAIDDRRTQHVGYAISQRKRKRIEECFGWPKTIALLRKVRHRGISNVGWIFTFAAAAYNLVRMRNLAIQATSARIEVRPLD